MISELKIYMIKNYLFTKKYKASMVHWVSVTIILNTRGSETTNDLNP